VASIRAFQRDALYCRDRRLTLSKERAVERGGGDRLPQSGCDPAPPRADDERL